MMTRKFHRYVLILLALLLWPLAVASAKEQGFNAIVKSIESHYRVHRTRIPFLGVANFAIKFVRPAGVKAFKLATFDDQDFSVPINDAAFEASLRNSLEKGWQPLVRRHAHRGGDNERLYIYTKLDGKDLQVISVTIEARQATVVEAKLDQAAMLRFMEKPEILGVAIGGRLTGKTSLGDLWAGNYTPSTHAASGDNLSSRLPADIAATPQSFDGTVSKPKTEATNLESGSKTALPAKANEQNDSSIQPDSSDASSSRSSISPPSPIDKSTIRLDTRLVNLNVKATDRAGKAISNLKPEDFEVYEDGIKQEVAFFEPVSAPINLVLLLDLSGSTHDRRKVMVEAVSKFVDVLGPQDKVAIAAFTRRFFVASDFTTDRKLLKQRVEKIKKLQGDTAYYDAMWTTLDLLREVKATRKAIVVMTDGIDNSLERGEDYQPAKHSFDDLLARVSEEDVTIYPIDVGEEVRQIKFSKWDTPEEVTRINERPPRPAEIARHQLEVIAEQTAGKVFRASRKSELEGVYQRVAAELHLLYSLAYDPKNTRANGEFRKVNVKVNRDGALARSKSGYYAK